MEINVGLSSCCPIRGITVPDSRRQQGKSRKVAVISLFSGRGLNSELSEHEERVVLYCDVGYVVYKVSLAQVLPYFPLSRPPPAPTDGVQSWQLTSLSETIFRLCVN